MIKNIAYNKIIISTLCLVLFLLFYLIPTNVDIKHETIEIKEEYLENYVYLLDEDNMVARVSSFYNAASIDDDLKKRIMCLMEGSNGFYPLINKNTKINKLYVDKDNVYLDFSKEFLLVNKYLEEKMVESLVFTLTEINGINNIYINVEGEEFRNLPNSGKSISYPLTRSFGINKEYNLNSLFNVSSTTVFFSKTFNDEDYVVPITKVSNTVSSKIDIIIEELKSSVNTSLSLNSFIDEDFFLLSSSLEDDALILNFNKKNYNSEVNNLIAESVFANYDVNEVNFLYKSNEKTDIINKK